jgi:toluene monooxygenase system protein D
MTESSADWVGPVLMSGPLTEAARAAIRELNPQAEFLDHGSYLRVLAPKECRLTRQALEKHAGTPLSFPSDLERILASFKGRFSVTEDEARWEAFGNRGGP